MRFNLYALLAISGLVLLSGCQNRHYLHDPLVHDGSTPVEPEPTDDWEYVSQETDGAASVVIINESGEIEYHESHGDQRALSSNTVTQTDHFDVIETEQGDIIVSDYSHGEFALPQQSLWSRYRMLSQWSNHTQKSEVQGQIKHIQRMPNFLNDRVKNLQAFMPIVLNVIEQKNLPVELAVIPIIESGYDPYAHSSAKAAGIWQFIPQTGHARNLEQSSWIDERLDLIRSTEEALNYLADLNQQFSGDWLLTLAAYNGGQSTVRSAMRANQKRGKSTSFWQLSLPKETEHYVPRILAVSELIRYPNRYQYDDQLPEVHDQNVLTVFEIEGILSLEVLANTLDIPFEELHQLNAQFLRKSTPPGEHFLLIPTDNLAHMKGLSMQQLTEMIQFKRVKIKKSQTLEHFALAHDFHLPALQELNPQFSKDTLLVTGETLLVPDQRFANDAYEDRYELLGTALKRHSVASGDSLWSIAKKYRVSLDQLLRWNQLHKKSLIYPGQLLIVGNTLRTKETTYRVRSGDSLWSIASKHNATIGQIKKWNQLTSNDLSAGQTLIIMMPE
ncbi:MAG: LysM peptidoglycan-binding domain-containing protein [Pseudomonadota bacterium]|nr:LysM peptidoglycan-binding domain-containing protein [Pseudomonadota bacterium]